MFGTSGIRGEFGTTVTARLALDVGRAVASEGAGCVAVGRDVRTTGPILVDAVTAGLRECGADVLDLGEVSTPTVARAVEWYDADAGVAVTASHNPPADNGLKLWDDTGKAVVGDRQDAIVSRVERDDYDAANWGEVGAVSTVGDAVERHVDAIVADGTPDGSADDEDGPERGALDVEVVLDVGNGTGALTASALRRAGADVRTMNADADGTFPARPNEPTAATCSGLAEAVAGSSADLGIAHDGDADRTMAVTESGAFVPGDVLLALFARSTASEGDVVAVPIDTSMAVTDALEAVGATTTYTRVGDAFVAERASDAGVVFGGEPSGAWIWPDETRCPDGPLAAVKLARMVADRGSLDALVDDVDSVPLQRTGVETPAKREVVEHVRTRVADRYATVTNVDGVRVDVADGWFLVRASGTEPLVRITAESRTPAGKERLFETASDLVDAAIDAVHAST